MSTPLRFLFVLPVLIGLSARPVQAGAGDATKVVQAGNERFRALLATKVPPGSEAEKKLTAQLTTDMRTLFDLRDLGRRALIDHWDKLTPAQQNEYVDALQRLVERSYVKQLRSNLKYEVLYTGEEQQKDGVVVKTVIKAQNDGRPVKTQVDYVLHAADGSWRVHDVITDEVGMVRNYRSQFHRIVTSSGFDGLMAKMKKRLAEDRD